MKGMLLLVLALVAPAAVGAQAFLETIGKVFESHVVVRAEFEQHKSIAALKRPLVTTGRLTFSREHGVLWRIERPYAAAYVMTEDNAIEIDTDGRRRKRSIREVPGLAHVNRVFRALLNADMQVLGEYFKVTARGGASSWELDLVPRQVQLVQALTRIRVKGGQFIDAIHVEEANGDATRIEFRNTSVAASLSKEERTLLDER